MRDEPTQTRTANEDKSGNTGSYNKSSRLILQPKFKS